MEHKLDIDQEQHAMQLLTRLAEMRVNKRNCDLAIKAGGEEIPVRKTVVASGSDFLEEMLTESAREHPEGGMLEIKDADAESVKKCIDFIYTGKASVSYEKCEQLMHAANMLKLWRLCNGITDFLSAGLSEESFYLARRIACKYECKKLRQKCEQFAVANFEALTHYEDLLELDKDCMSYVIRAKNTNATEILKCDALVKWAKHDEKNRKKIFVKLLKHLKLTAVPIEYRKWLIENEPLVSEVAECMRLFTLSVFDTANIKASPLLPEDGDAATKEEEVKQILVFDKTSHALQCFNPIARKWKPMQDMHADMLKTTFSAVIVGGYLYVLLRNKAMYRLQCTVVEALWERMADYTSDHGNFPPVTFLGDCIYIVGGSLPTMTSTVEKYDASKNEWTKVENKAMRCRDSSTVSAQERIYSLGGMDWNSKYLNEVERFDPETSLWEFVAPMLQAKWTPAAVEFENKIYVLGGYNGEYLSDVECYSPSDNAWVSVTPMKVRRWRFSAAISANAIFAVGGMYGAKSVEKYDFEKKKWEIVAKWKKMNLEGEASVSF